MSVIKLYKTQIGASLVFFILFMYLAIRYNSDQLILLAGTSLLLIGALVYFSKWTAWFYQVLLVTLFLSVEIPILSGSRVSLPDEILIIILSTAGLLCLLLKESIYKTIIRIDLIIIILVHAGMFLISSFFSTMQLISFKFSLINILYMSCGVFTTTILLLQRQITFKKIIHIFSIPLAILCVYTIINFAPHGFSSQASIMMAQPFFKDHTLLSASISMFIPIYLFYPWIYPKSGTLLKTAAISLAFLLLFIVVISSSRAAWLSLIIGFIFYLFILMKGSFIRLIQIFSLAIVVSFIYSGEILNKLNSNYNSSGSEHASIEEQVLSASNIHSDVSNLERLNRWKCAIRMAQDKPIIGFGPGTYQFQYLDYQLEQDKTSISVNNPFNSKQGYGGSAHSEYFLVLSEMGILGFISWVMVLFYTIYSYFRIRNNRWIDRQNILIADAVTIALITFFTHSLFNNFLNSAKTSIPFWILIGFLVFQTTQLKKHEESN